jgi:hypothetical protein
VLGQSGAICAWPIWLVRKHSYDGHEQPASRQGCQSRLLAALPGGETLEFLAHAGVHGSVVITERWVRTADA